MTSLRERRLWLWVLLATLAIFSTLFLGQPLADLMKNQNVQAVFFVAGMAMVAGAVTLHGLKLRSGLVEWSAFLGLLAVNLMLFLRLGLAERTHLIEYSVVAILVHRAVEERARNRKLVLPPALAAIVIAIGIGALDECLQIFIPDRYFDPVDIAFNSCAVILAIVAVVFMKWIRRRNKPLIPDKENDGHKKVD